MRYRDQPTVEETQRVRCDIATGWGYVTDITVPAQCSAGHAMQANLDWIRSQVES